MRLMLLDLDFCVKDSLNYSASMKAGRYDGIRGTVGALLLMRWECNDWPIFVRLKKFCTTERFVSNEKQTVYYLPTMFLSISVKVRLVPH